MCLFVWLVGCLVVYGKGFLEHSWFSVWNCCAAEFHGLYGVCSALLLIMNFLEFGNFSKTF